jgi:hypothetical protein
MKSILELSPAASDDTSRGHPSDLDIFGRWIDFSVIFGRAIVHIWFGPNPWGRYSGYQNRAMWLTGPEFGPFIFYRTDCGDNERKKQIIGGETSRARRGRCIGPRSSRCAAHFTRRQRGQGRVDGGAPRRWGSSLHISIPIPVPIPTVLSGLRPSLGHRSRCPSYPLLLSDRRPQLHGDRGSGGKRVDGERCDDGDHLSSYPAHLHPLTILSG